MDPRILPALLALGVAGLVLSTRRASTKTPAAPIAPGGGTDAAPGATPPPPGGMVPAQPRPQPVKQIGRTPVTTRARLLTDMLRTDDGRFALLPESQTGIQGILERLRRNAEDPPIAPADAANLRAQLEREYLLAQWRHFIRLIEQQPEDVVPNAPAARALADSLGRFGLASQAVQLRSALDLRLASPDAAILSAARGMLESISRGTADASGILGMTAHARLLRTRGYPRTADRLIAAIATVPR